MTEITAKEGERIEASNPSASSHVEILRGQATRYLSCVMRCDAKPFCSTRTRLCSFASAPQDPLDIPAGTNTTPGKGTVNKISTERMEQVEFGLDAIKGI